MSPYFLSQPRPAPLAIMDVMLDLASGTKIPQFGLGTWQSTNEDDVRRSINTALDTGYKLIDTARLYANEHVIGQVLKERFSDGRLKREDIFITSKICMNYLGSKELVQRCVELSLKDLDVDYIDLYLIHFPTGFQFTKDDAFFPRDDEGTLMLDMKSDFLQVWKSLEEYVDSGRIKALGVSNFTISQMERIQKIAKHPLTNNQVEMNVYFQQKPLVEFCKKNKITVTAYAPLGSPGAEHVRAGNLPALLKNDTMADIAGKKGKTVAQVAMRFLIQEGVAVIPKSVTPSRVVENSQLFDFTLTDEEMEALRNLDKNLRNFKMEITSEHPEYPYK